VAAARFAAIGDGGGRARRRSGARLPALAVQVSAQRAAAHQRRHYRHREPADLRGRAAGARRRERRSASYAGPEIAKQQKAAYPDLAPLKVGLPPDQAFSRALDTAKTMPGWTVVAADPATGRIEARQTSRWFRFTDDVVIRVAAEAPGSRIDMRSESRQGRSDFGVNANRIRAYMATLRKQLG